jgi:hypothetical protein
MGNYRLSKRMKIYTEAGQRLVSLIDDAPQLRKIVIDGFNENTVTTSMVRNVFGQFV